MIISLAARFSVVPAQKVFVRASQLRLRWWWGERGNLRNCRIGARANYFIPTAARAVSLSPSVVARCESGKSKGRFPNLLTFNASLISRNRNSCQITPGVNYSSLLETTVTASLPFKEKKNKAERGRSGILLFYLRRNGSRYSPNGN